MNVKKYQHISCPHPPYMPRFVRHQTVLHFDILTYAIFRGIHVFEKLKYICFPMLPCKYIYVDNACVLFAIYSQTDRPASMT
jgi:hypothetical protein